MIKIYTARAMSGRSMEEVVREAYFDKWLFEKNGIKVLDPVSVEGVKPKKKKLKASKNLMKKYWPRDKAMIREAHVFVDCTPHLKSQGVERESGYARYCLWKPIVRLFPFNQLPAEGSVAYFEDDIITDDLIKAVQLIKDKWGTPKKRIIWRLNLLRRCLWKFILYQLKEFK